MVLEEEVYVLCFQVKENIVIDLTDFLNVKVGIELLYY